MPPWEPKVVPRPGELWRNRFQPEQINLVLTPPDGKGFLWIYCLFYRCNNYRVAYDFCLYHEKID